MTCTVYVYEEDTSFIIKGVLYYIRDTIEKNIYEISFKVYLNSPKEESNTDYHTLLRITRITAFNKLFPKKLIFPELNRYGSLLNVRFSFSKELHMNNIPKSCEIILLFKGSVFNNKIIY